MSQRSRTFIAIHVLACATVSASSPVPLFEDVTETHLPSLVKRNMDAGVVDVDGDGDLDVVLAVEFGINRLLINDGHGVFTYAGDRLPGSRHDSEDVGIADFDGDGDPDFVFVSEDDYVNELFLNDGSGFFSDASERIPVQGRSEAVAVSDIDGDGSPDIVIGNAGYNVILLNDGEGFFVADSERLPLESTGTQDLELGDVDNDGDLDLLLANEGDNMLLLNDGNGYFTNAEGRIPLRDSREETREADFGDVDCDGDLDVYFANVDLFVAGAQPQNRLLINDGDGFFSDETGERLPPDTDQSYEVDFIDVDCDGDLDVVTGNGHLELNSIGNAEIVEPLPYRVYLNDGSGYFRDATHEVFPPGVEGYGWDVAAADFNSDGALDLYLASRYLQDRLLLAHNRPPCRRVPCGATQKGPRCAGARVAP